MTQIRTLHDLIERIGPRLKLRWLTPPPGPSLPLRPAEPNVLGQSLVGPLNCIHPNRLQVIGHAEHVYLGDLGETAHAETIEKLFAGHPTAVIFVDDIEPEASFFSWAQRTATPLLGTSLSDEETISHLQFFLTHELAERIVLHGVFMEVLGTGVLLIGDPAAGKSELALDLVNRGHRLIADDAPEFANIAPEVLEGTCPPLLQDFLEVRGLGILNIRAMFGESAIEQRKQLNLIVNLRTLDESQLAGIDRLSGTLSARHILGVTVPEVTMPVAPGRNLAILVEAAVRNQILRIRGYDAGVDFTERQARELQNAQPTPIESLK